MCGSGIEFTFSGVSGELTIDVWRKRVSTLSCATPWGKGQLRNALGTFCHSVVMKSIFFL